MTARRLIGTTDEVSLELAAWDAAAAQVELSVACMFQRELSATGPVGGLLTLDQLLSGALTALRRRGAFKAERMETLFIGVLQQEVAADALMIIGLGDPSDWTPMTTARAVAVAVREAAQRSVKSVAFAPSLLDSGLGDDKTSGLTRPMVGAVVEAIRSQKLIADFGLAQPLQLTRWIFDIGAARFDSAFQRFEEALEAAKQQS